MYIRIHYSNSRAVVATLIVTVVISAIVAVPYSTYYTIHLPMIPPILRDSGSSTSSLARPPNIQIYPYTIP